MWSTICCLHGKLNPIFKQLFQAPWDAALGLVGPMGLGGFHHATGRWVGAVKKSRQLDAGPRFEEVPTNRQLEAMGSDASMWGRRQRLEVNWDPWLSKTCQTSKLSSSIMPSLWWVTIRARTRLTCCEGFSANSLYYEWQVSVNENCDQGKRTRINVIEGRAAMSTSLLNWGMLRCWRLKKSLEEAKWFLGTNQDRLSRMNPVAIALLLLWPLQLTGERQNHIACRMFLFHQSMGRFPKKSSCSVGFCPNYLDPPPFP